MDRKRIFTIPNFISFFRLLLTIPVGIFLWREDYLALALVIALGIASDFLDGILARRLRQISDLGKMLDPLADKLAIGLTAIILYLKNQMPLWLVILIVGRDIAILIGGLFYAKKFNQVVPSNVIGKITANVLAITLVSYIFQIKHLMQFFSILAVIFVVISSISYLIRLINHLQGKKALIP